MQTTLCRPFALATSDVHTDDKSRPDNGGLRVTPSRALNVLVSAVITLAFAITVVVGHDLHAAIGVIGIWAGLSGLL